MHLEANGAGAGLTFTLAGGAFAELREVLLADAFGGEMLFQFAAAIVDADLEMHLGFSVEAFKIGLELALIGADGFAEAFIVLKDGAEAEGEDGGLLEAIGDHPCMVDSGFLVEGLGGVVFADDDG